ncbi:hypothetical protein GCM10010252_59420 [Streptomyces aureoverticillatus]|nr:hypothetical protein GCM10010252_59420 [Streptomyces aureoverticillatus]
MAGSAMEVTPAPARGVVSRVPPEPPEPSAPPGFSGPTGLEPARALEPRGPELACPAEPLAVAAALASPACPACARAAARRRRAGRVGFRVFVVLSSALCAFFFTAAVVAAVHGAFPATVAFSGVGTLSAVFLATISTLVYKKREHDGS